MATATPSPPPISPHEEVENNQQSPIVCSPPQTSVPSPPSPVEDVDHHQQQFTNTNSPNSLPENSVDRQQPPPPEDGEDVQEPPVPPSPPPEEKIIDGQQPFTPPSPSYLPPPEGGEDVQEPPAPPSPPPEEKIIDGQQPFAPPSPSSLTLPSPPPTEVEQPPENPTPNHESPVSKDPPSPSPSPPPTGAEDPVESPNYRVSPNPNPSLNSDHESLLSNQPPSPSTPPTVHEDPVESPNYRINPNSDHESSPAELQGNPSPITKQSPKDLSPSPPLTAGSPSSPQDTLEPDTELTTPPLGVPLFLHAVARSSPSKPQISPWTHQETANLIQAYQEKWYSLKKGPLKAGQWEEVAITVAARCGYDEPTKTSKQCRHKIEKLRKRYRAERGKPRSKATAWNFFKLMENLEKGPLPISSSPPMALVEYQKPSNSNGKKRKNDDGDDGGDREFLVNRRSTRSRNSNQHVPNGSSRDLRFPDSGNRVVRGLRTPVVHKRKGFYQEDDGGEEEEVEEEEDNGENGGEEGDVAVQLAAEIKGFTEKLVKMEKKKIEMIREVEKYRLEMENKRMEMIIESQQMLVETVNKAFSRSHKTHKLSAN